MGVRKDEAIINTWVDDYYIVGRVKSNDRHLACIHKDNFADDIKNISKDFYILKRYCNVCETLKNIDDFIENFSRCKECTRIYNKNRNQKNKEKNSFYGKCYYQKNKRKIRKNGKIYNQNNKEKIRIYSNNYIQIHKEQIKERNKSYYQNNKDNRSNYGKKYYITSALFDTFSHQIDFCEDTRRAQDNSKLLEVKCTEYGCQKWFRPTNRQIQARLQVINGTAQSIGVENHFYCSEECKQKCPLYKMKISQVLSLSTKQYTPGEYNVWKFEVKRRNILESDDNKLHCEYCHSTEDLVIHHIYPQKTHPHMSLDPDNGLVCCKKCHMERAHKDECSTGNLAQLVCTTKEESNGS